MLGYRETLGFALRNAILFIVASAVKAVFIDKLYKENRCNAFLMQKRNKFALLVTMPIVVVLWVVGWIFFWMASYRRKAGKGAKQVRSELRFALLAPEEKCIG
jgi:heme/copper-type cytochrome/quinol oxidase subunit 2